MPEGPGRVLVAVYGLFALAAGARSGVQLATASGRAPLAYALSAVAAAVYLVAALALARGRLRVALAACAIELAGVLVVGTLTLADGGLFPDETVWSGYGAGYGYIPLVLPVLGLLYITRSRRRPAHRRRTPPPPAAAGGGRASVPRPAAPAAPHPGCGDRG